MVRVSDGAGPPESEACGPLKKLFVLQKAADVSTRWLRVSVLCCQSVSVYLNPPVRSGKRVILMEIQLPPSVTLNSHYCWPL